MPLSVTTGFTDATSSDAIQSFFDTYLLVRGTYALIHHIPLMKKPLSQRHGKNMIWRRYEVLPLATQPLTEGQSPAGRTKTKTDVSATIALYGDFIENSDFLLLTQPEAVAAEDVELQGQQMGETFDQIDQTMWGNLTNIVYSNGSALNTIAEIPDKNDLDRLHRLLKNNKAREFVPEIMASQKFGTGPIMPAYWGLCHEDMAFDLRHVDGFRLVAEYGNSGAAIAGEFGADKNGFRFLSSPNGFVQRGAGASGAGVKNTASVVDVYSLFAVGQQAAAGVDLTAGNGGVIRQTPGGIADPLELRSTTGWKKYYTNKILNQNFAAEMYAAASL